MSSLTALDRAKRIKVILFDVDGVLTDGKIFVIPTSEDASHAVEAKGFHAHDGLGISLARISGMKIGAITKRVSNTVAIRCRDLKLEYVYQGQSYKMKAVNEIIAKEGITLDQICYVGDDVIDLPVMRVCGLSIATANARDQVKACSHFTTAHAGGDGAGRDAIEFILAAKGVLEATIEAYLDEDNTAAAAADIGHGGM